jgi:hypothetical protein
MDFPLMREDEIELARIAGPERKAKGERRGVLGLDRQNLAVVAAPEMVVLHWKRGRRADE